LKINYSDDTALHHIWSNYPNQLKNALTKKHLKEMSIDDLYKTTKELLKHRFIKPEKKEPVTEQDKQEVFQLLKKYSEGK